MKNSIIAMWMAVALGTAGLALAQHEGHGEHAKGAKAATTAPATGPTTKQVAGKPINQYCPINSDEKIDSKVTTVYKGKTIGFCCEDCIDTFNKNPEKYMKTLK